MAVARENFLFLGSDRGGERAAVTYTLTETARLNGLNPEACGAATPARVSQNSCPGSKRKLMAAYRERGVCETLSAA